MSGQERTNRMISTFRKLFSSTLLVAGLSWRMNGSYEKVEHE